MAVVRSAALASEKTVGTFTRPLVGIQSFQSTWCLAGSTPVSIETCDGSVLLGKMVFAVQVYAPSSSKRLKIGIWLPRMTEGFPPSRLMINTCSACGAARATEATNQSERKQINRRCRTNIGG